MKTGVNKVPNPKPEKKVKMAVKKATIDMIIISIFYSNKIKHIVTILLLCADFKRYTIDR